MQRSLLYKFLIILGLTAVICVAMQMIQHTIRERSQYRAQAVQSIAADSVREQTIVGPILVVDYIDEYEEAVAGSGDKVGTTEMVARSVRRQHLAFPNELTVDGMIQTESRYRGIHEVLTFTGKHSVMGDFQMPLKSELPRANLKSRITLSKLSVALGIDDVRGIRDIPRIDWGGENAEFQQGTGLPWLASGLHAKVASATLENPQNVRFTFDLGLAGIERQHFVPVAKNNVITLKSNWVHPQFGGNFLPSSRPSVTDNGFAARWAISSLSTNAQQDLRQMQAAPEARGGYVGLDRFSVGFIEPVNVYTLSERATKYGLLFVALTFGAFLVFELVKRLPIHPVQYLLVGLALVLFFLLLVSLSELIEFMLAYLIASAACIVLIGFYLSSVLRDWRRGLGFGTGLTLLYGALYGLLISENNALVLGSLLLFAILAAVMVAKRKVDWYQLGQSPA